MKKIFTLLFCSALIVSCTSDGPQGPPGPPGPQGPPGDGGIIGSVIDYEGVNFNAGNEYSFLADFNDAGIEVFETDAVLVYMKVGEDGTAGGAPVEVFRMLPQTYYIDGGALQFNFDFTFFDVNIFLDGTVDLAAVDNSFTQNRVFRIVIVPAEFAATGVNMADMKAVLNELNITQQDIKKARVKQ